MQQELQILNPIDVKLHRGKVVPLNTKDPIRLRPKMEQALRLYATGQVGTEVAAAALAGCTPMRFGQVLNSPAGQAVVDSIRQQLDFQYSSLYKKFIGVVSDGLDHPDPGVALTAAKLFAQTNIGSKVKVELSAEDIIQSIMNGTYKE